MATKIVYVPHTTNSGACYTLTIEFTTCGYSNSQGEYIVRHSRRYSQVKCVSMNHLISNTSNRSRICHYKTKAIKISNNKTYVIRKVTFDRHVVVRNANDPFVTLNLIALYRLRPHLIRSVWNKCLERWKQAVPGSERQEWKEITDDQR